VNYDEDRDRARENQTRPDAASRRWRPLGYGALTMIWTFAAFAATIFTIVLANVVLGRLADPGEYDPPHWAILVFGAPLIGWVVVFALPGAFAQSFFCWTLLARSLDPAFEDLRLGSFHYFGPRATLVSPLVVDGWTAFWVRIDRYAWQPRLPGILAAAVVGVAAVVGLTH
jgi:hypothetical protein